MRPTVRTTRPRARDGTRPTGRHVHAARAHLKRRRRGGASPPRRRRAPRPRGAHGIRRRAPGRHEPRPARPPTTTAASAAPSPTTPRRARAASTWRCTDSLATTPMDWIRTAPSLQSHEGLLGRRRSLAFRSGSSWGRGGPRGLVSLLKPHASLIASSDEDAAPNAPSEAKTLRREPTRQNRHWPMAEVDPGTVGQARHMTSEPRNLNVDHNVLDTLITDARARFDIEKDRGEQADTQATELTALAAALAIVLANELAHQTATATVSAAIAGLTLFL